jgi:hypothetical protein
MSTSRLRVFGATLLGSCCSMFILVSAGGAADGGNFILGVLTNSASSTTHLSTTAQVGLDVSDTGSSSVAIRGYASPLGGAEASRELGTRPARARTALRVR